MPKRNITLTEHFAAFLDAHIESGAYRNASEVVGDALRLLEQQKAENQLRLKRLRDEVAAGFAEIDRGEFTEIDKSEIRPAIQRIGKRAVVGLRDPAE